jgi:hypothetical protein
MNRTLAVLALWAVSLAASTATHAQQAAPEDAVPERAQQVIEDTREKVESIAKDVDQSERAREVSAGLLKPVYALAEHLAFPAFHWVAFTLMTAGVVGFALQLVLAKLAVLAKMSFSLREVLSDALGLAISVVGLVLTTQAAAENSDFTRRPAAVLSAAAVGALAGFIHYRWGQSQELQAALGRKQGAGTPAK